MGYETMGGELEVKELEGEHGVYLHFYRESDVPETWVVNWRLSNGQVVFHDYEYWCRQFDDTYVYRTNIDRLTTEERALVSNILELPDFTSIVNGLIDEWAAWDVEWRRKRADSLKIEVASDEEQQP